MVLFGNLTEKYRILALSWSHSLQKIFKIFFLLGIGLVPDSESPRGKELEFQGLVKFLFVSRIFLKHFPSSHLCLVSPSQIALLYTLKIINFNSSDDLKSGRHLSGCKKGRRLWYSTSQTRFKLIFLCKPHLIQILENLIVTISMFWGYSLIGWIYSQPSLLQFRIQLSWFSKCYHLPLWFSAFQMLLLLSPLLFYFLKVIAASFLLYFLPNIISNKSYIHIIHV